MKNSDRLLLELYKFRPYLNDKLALTTGQLAWVLDNKNEKWVGSDGPNSHKYSGDKGEDISYMDRPIRDRNRVIKELTSLSANSSVEFEAPSGFETVFRVSILPNGILRAEKLESRIGRIDLWFIENKNGIIGAIITAAISIVVSYATAVITTANG